MDAMIFIKLRSITNMNYYKLSMLKTNVYMFNDGNFFLYLFYNFLSKIRILHIDNTW